MIPAWTLAMMDSASFSPLDLGSKLKAWWAPPGGANTTLNGSGIASWTDEVGGYVLGQATGASQPLYSATGFNGLSCAVFDGSNDSLSIEGVPAGIPTGAAPSESWACVRQDMAAGTDKANIVIDYGVTTSGGAARRILQRRAEGGVNRARAIAESFNAENASVDFSGYHVVRGRFGAASVQCDVDGIAGASGAITLNTGNARLRVGSSTNSTTQGTWVGAIREILITEPLTSDEAARLLAYLNKGL